VRVGEDVGGGIPLSSPLDDLTALPTALPHNLLSMPPRPGAVLAGAVHAMPVRHPAAAASWQRNRSLPSVCEKPSSPLSAGLPPNASSSQLTPRGTGRASF